MPKITAHKYIVRFDYDRAHCWQFRYATNNDWSKPVNKSFSDSKYGSRKKAFIAAIEYRNKHLKRIGKLSRLHKVGHAKRHRHALNTSGVIGVSRYINYKQSDSYLGWQAYGMYEGKTWRRSFSADKYSDKGAFRAACKERYDRHGRLSIHCKIKYLPCSPGVPWERFK